MSTSNGNEAQNQWRVKVGLAEMLKGGVIMDVTNAEQARIAEQAGACAVMALERVPADIRKEGGVARMASPRIIREIMDTVSIPVMAKARIGHFAEAQVLRSAGGGLHRRERSADAGRRGKPYLEARFQGAVRLRRAQSGRSAAPHRRRRGHDPHQGRSRLGQHRGSRAPHAHHRRRDAPADDVARRRIDARGQGTGRAAGAGRRSRAQRASLPVPNFSAGGIATPADAALVRQLGAEAVFVGSGIFKSSDPAQRARAIVKAATHYQDAKAVLEASQELGEAMKGLDVRQLDPKELLQTRGW